MVGWLDGWMDRQTDRLTYAPLHGTYILYVCKQTWWSGKISRNVAGWQSIQSESNRWDEMKWTDVCPATE